ncbi:hypothetical protein [Dyadobacter frigoris]|uniref:DUF4156 domain-containing protein n=1 Tax=Dyadobacter frigoris TaxID=2576211 RepID=A0A4U6DAT5_9BACT|nr:hypothetical protein [Dyadobacter frigoris]TKT93835.1 hypothetical protein FDK13_01075 [Dyadobacter frigoris]
MKNLLKLVLLIFVLSSCASVKVERLTGSSPKSRNCNLEVFNNESEVKRKFQVVCSLDSKTGNSIWNKRTAEAAIENAKNKACECGADAIVVTSSGRTKLKFYSYRRGVASMKGVKYL